MEVKIYPEMLTFVNPSAAEEKDVEKAIRGEYQKRETQNGFMIVAKKPQLFDLLLALSFNYDIEIN